MTNTMRRRLLATTLLTICSAPTFAQAPAAAAADDGAGDIVVTGSRIARPNEASNSPIQVVTGEQVIANGDVTLDTYLNTLPGVNPAGTSTSNNPGNGGQSNINLRGLGSNRNLVLVNGRRPMVSASDQTVDLNTIPQALIERIEVITGGAGATYGADAVAGVVNVITKSNFQGIDLRASYSNAIPKTDAREAQASATFGYNFPESRGNVAVSFDYLTRQGLTKAQRAFAAQAVSTTGTPPVGRLIENNPIPQAAINALFASYGVAASQYPISSASQLHINPDGTLFGAGIFNNPLDVSNYRYDPKGIDAAAANQNFYPDFYSYNFDAINALVLPLDRKSAFGRFNYKFADAFEVFGQGSYTTYKSQTASAPTPIGTRIYNPTTPGGVSFATSPLVVATKFVTNSIIPTTNPFIPKDLATLLAARTGDDANLVGSGATEPFRFGIRTLGAGLRISNYDNEVIQGLIGVRGQIAPGFRYEAYYSYGRTQIDRSATGNINVQKLQTLLEAPDGGRSICSGGYNPFGIQPVSQACLDYLTVVGKTKNVFTQKIGQAFITGDLATLPAGTLTAVVGVEKRDFRYDFDPGALSGPIAGFNTQDPAKGTNSFFDIFGEALIPLAKGESWAQDLTLSLGYRYSRAEFNDIQKALSGPARGSSAYKAELSWAPVDALRLRATYQRSVRAPNFGELFDGGSSFVSAFDPCSATTRFRTSGGANAKALCIANGVGSASADSFAATPGLQVNTSLAGNTNLLPEKADTFTFGGVFKVGKLRGSLDYYNIRISDAIQNIDTNLIIAACYGYQGTFNTALSSTSPYCTSITRSGGSLSSITVDPKIGGDATGNFVPTNIGKVQTSGIDFQLAYDLPTPFIDGDSSIKANLLLNYLISYKAQELPGVTLEYAGTASYFGQGLGTSFPRWKGNLDLAWDISPLTLSTRIRYIDAMKNRASVQFPGETFTSPKSVWYFDFGFGARVGAMGFKIGVNNAFDRKPPTYAPNVQSGTDPSLYDIVGRRVYAQASLRF